MHLRTLLQAVFATIVAFGPVALGGAAVQAQQYQNNRAYGPIINGFNVEEVRSLTPGVELHFDLYGSAGGTATLRIDGATRNLYLTEVEPGQYTGTYTIGSRDRIKASSGVTANLRLGNQVATSLLSESVLASNAQRGERRGQLASNLAIKRFDVQGAPDLGPGNELRFTLVGTPGARAEVAIAGTRGVFFLPEVRPGEYEAIYTVRNRDVITADSRVTATIRANGRSTTSVLARPLLVAARAEQQRVARYCTNCATVEAVNLIEVSGNGNYLGTVGGALIGGLLGNQVGGGSGRTAASVAGAVAGGLAGRNIERNMNKAERYEVVVRYTTNGATQTLQYDNDPGLRQGDRVRVNNGVLTRDQ
ncbi:glycine zipper 2TM domain-containing protein [Massilia sp. H6]|uniref:glycine zipper 2TM domain-containing protein n=1 Tax=Massilia sp. H6 TaxID=2970464 RepID=UPI002169A9FB|nr:glycine zipper 2TM domain-containing protein [Massilia sp. H6]UVW27754.1 glycine zipper 2TM domain-containing protein [Massilia sp. H6]